MRENSYICDLIYNLRDSPDAWRRVLEEKNIKIKQEDNLCIFNYGIECDFSDPVVREARGIIIDLSNCHVVCRAFDKFFNVQESYAADIDWDTAVVQEKIDGSIIKIWWSNKLNKWVYSTNSVIFAENAKCNTIYSFYDVIMKSSNINNIMDVLSNDTCRLYTWIFELVSPYNQIVVKYDKPILYHIGCRANFNGKEYDQSKFFSPTPKRYNLKTLDNCLETVKELNKTETVEHEGFVVVDKHFNRVKIKSPEYLYFHRVIQNHSFKKENIIELVLNSSYEQLMEIAEQFEELKVRIKYYDFAIEQFRNILNNFLHYCINISEEYDRDKKAIALAIKNNSLSGYGFTMLNKGKSIDDILNNLTIKDYCKFIKDYEELENEIIFYGRYPWER